MLNTSLYIPANLRTQPLFQNVEELVNKLFNTYTAELNLLYQKYDFFGATDASMQRALIAELGFEYITDVLQLDDAETAKLLTYLPLIQYLKGTRAGLELVLSLLGLTYTISEWWEVDPPGPILTATVSAALTSFETEYAGAQKLSTFLSQYVFPLCTVIAIEVVTTTPSITYVSGGLVTYEKITMNSKSYVI